MCVNKAINELGNKAINELGLVALALFVGTVRTQPTDGLHLLLLMREFRFGSWTTASKA